MHVCCALLTGVPLALKCVHSNLAAQRVLDPAGATDNVTRTMSFESWDAADKFELD